MSILFLQVVISPDACALEERKLKVLVPLQQKKGAGVINIHGNYSSVTDL